jgi:hypothetical protein
VRYHNAYLAEFEIRKKDAEIFDIKALMERMTINHDKSIAEIRASTDRTIADNRASADRTIAEIRAANARLSDQVETVGGNLTRALDRRVPDINFPQAKREDLVVYKLYQAENSEFYNYHIQCRQKRTVPAGFRSLRVAYPQASEVFRLPDVPNSKNLFNRVKKASQALVAFDAGSNHFDLKPTSTMAALVELITAENLRKVDLSE